MADRSLLGFFVAPLGSPWLLIGGWDSLLLLMIPFTPYSLLWLFVAHWYTLWLIVASCRPLWVIVALYGWLWLTVDHCKML